MTQDNNYQNNDGTLGARNPRFETLRKARFEARLDAQKRALDKLEKIFESSQKTISVRELRRRHGIKREEAFFCVKNKIAIYGVAEFKPARGGSKSIVIFLRSNPPKNLVSKRVHTPQCKK